MPKIKAVLFDLGETLLNFGVVDKGSLFRSSARVSYDFLKKSGIAVGSYKWYCIRNFAALRFHYWLSNVTGNDFDSFSLLKKMNSGRGNELSEEMCKKLVWLWYEPLSKAVKVERDIKETLGKLQAMGLKLGILSNTFVHSSALEKHLADIGVLDFFEPRLYSYQFSFRKPNQRIFTEIAKRVGEKNENIMFVGDRVDNDIEPAINAGMKAVLKKAYTNEGKRIPEEALRIEHISELPGLIEKLNLASGE